MPEEELNNLARIGMLQLFGQSMAMEDIVTQHQATGLASGKLPANQIGLCQTIRTGLFSVLELYTVIAAVSQ